MSRASSLHPPERSSLRRVARVSMALLFSSAVGAAAQDSASRLHFTPPTGWTQQTDAATHLVSLGPTGGGAAVTFAGSAEFSGTAEQWHAEFWKQLTGGMTPATQPVSGRQGAFLTSMGVFASPDGSLPWLCLYTLVDHGRGEAVLYIAKGETEFLAHLATVNELIYRTTVGGAPPAVAPAPGASQPAAAYGDVPGLYVATKQQFQPNVFGGVGSGSWVLGTESYLLSADGRAYRARGLPQAPGGDITRFDFAAAARSDPANSGSYTARGNEVVIQLGVPPSETIAARRTGPNTLDIYGVTFTRGLGAN